MKGTILLFNTESGEGLINSTSDVRFKFSRKSWISDSVPKTGDRVDFVADGEFAKEICLDPDFFPQGAADDSSGQHTRQPPPTPTGRTQESDPPVPFNVMEEDDLPRSIVLAVELSCTFASIVAGVIIVIAMGINPYSRSEQQVVMGVVIFAAVLWFAAVLVQAIYRLRIIYIMWKSIQPFGVRISPVAAVGYCLIPLFNIYWLFRVYHDWEQDFNSKVRDSHPHLPPIRTGRAKTAYISTIVSALLSIIPIIGLIAVYIINLGLVVPFLSRADRRARYLLDGLDPLPPLRSGIRRTPRQHQSSTPLIENGIDENTDRNWAMFLHLSLLLAPLVFAVTMMPVILLVGNIATIAIWQVKKGDVPGLDQHGRSVANWIISCVVYLIVLFILRSFDFFFMSEIFYVIQQGLASAIVVCYLVFPIIGGLKAKKGEVWRYPLAIPFFS
jgi:uncharacterized Tic20 family protein